MRIKENEWLISLFIDKAIIEWQKIEKDSYLRDIDAISGVKEVTFRKPVTFFVGENGSGKSTLLEAIAVAYGFNPEGGTRNYNFSTYDSHSELCEAMRLSKGVKRPKAEQLPSGRDISAGRVGSRDPEF